MGAVYREIPPDQIEPNPQQPRTVFDEEALAELEGVEVVNGSITYAGTNGVPSKTVAVVEIEDGAFVFKEAITPSFIPEP